MAQTAYDMAGCSGERSSLGASSGAGAGAVHQPADVREGLANAYNVMTTVSSIYVLILQLLNCKNVCLFRELETQLGICTRQQPMSMRRRASVEQLEACLGIFLAPYFDP